MSLLNIASDGLPQILVLLHHAVLRAKKSLNRSDLLEQVAPEKVVDDGDKARQTLNRWVELGLFTEIDGAIDLAHRPAIAPGQAPTTLAASAVLARQAACCLVLAPENNMDLWALRDARAADLTRSLAWMLAQDVYRSSFRNFAEAEAAQIADTNLWMMRNSTRVNGLKMWSRFLGFSLEPFADIDPTVAVRDALPQILGAGSGMPASEFVERLVQILPVLDGGYYQAQVLEQLERGALVERRPGLLSTALSRSLWNLRASGELKLERRSDLGSAIALSGAAGERAGETYQWVGRPLNENAQ